MKNKKILWITETAVMLALLVTLQALTKGFGQMVTGSFVNAVLAVTALLCGMYSGITVAVISPVLAYFLGIAPQVLTVPAIMVGNTVYVVILNLLVRKDIVRGILGWLLASTAKFGVLYGIVKGLICGVFAADLLEVGLLKEPMLNLLPATFSWPQLFTALIGGGVALLITPVLKKALHK